MNRLATRSLLAARRFALRARSFSDHHEVPEAYKDHVISKLTMNNGGYPVPKMSYAEAYSKTQAKNNKMLGGAILCLAGALTFVISQDTFSYLYPIPSEVRNWKLDEIEESVQYHDRLVELFSDIGEIEQLDGPLPPSLAAQLV